MYRILHHRPELMFSHSKKKNGHNHTQDLDLAFPVLNIPEIPREYPALPY